MALPTFTPPVPPSPGTTNKPEFAIHEAPFGDGYTGAAAAGLNNVRDVLTLSWDVLLPGQAALITRFLSDRRGVGVFYYTPSNEGAPLKWTCKEFTDKRGEAGMRTVTATFRRSFNPAA